MSTTQYPYHLIPAQLQEMKGVMEELADDRKKGFISPDIEALSSQKISPFKQALALKKSPIAASSHEQPKIPSHSCSLSYTDTPQVGYDQ